MTLFLICLFILEAFLSHALDIIALSFVVAHVNVIKVVVADALLFKVIHFSQLLFMPLHVVLILLNEILHVEILAFVFES